MQRVARRAAEGSFMTALTHHAPTPCAVQDCGAIVREAQQLPGHSVDAAEQAHADEHKTDTMRAVLVTLAVATGATASAVVLAFAPPSAPDPLRARTAPGQTQALGGDAQHPPVQRTCPGQLSGRPS